jgi:hypothetical protein
MIEFEIVSESQDVFREGPIPEPTVAACADSEAFGAVVSVTLPHERQSMPDPPVALKKESAETKTETEHDSHTNGDGAVMFTLWSVMFTDALVIRI